jgi:hypothetical protein
LLKRPPFVVALVVALLASASTWFYMNRILRAQQIADAALHNRPRGNLSDLYPRWLGARELLRHGRNPYTPEITREIQQGYYGRPLDPARPYDPKDQQGFAYPVYVVFLLAPTVDLPWDTVQFAFRLFLIVLGAASILFWLRVLHWRATWGTKVISIVLILGWWPMVQGLKLQQLTLLVAGLLAGCGVCLSGGWLFCAGGLLALATIKPQLAWPLVLWLLLWAGSNWRLRRRFIFGFALVMMLLFGGAELVLPGWLRMFFQAIGEYHHYVQNESGLATLFGLLGGRIVGVACALACLGCVWSLRKESESTEVFGRAFALVLALAVTIVPMSALYNQVLLVPAILALVRSEIASDSILPAVRKARAIGAFLLAWPWIATLLLTAAYPWLTPGVRERVWTAPLYTSLMLPIFVFGLALLDLWMNRTPGLRDAIPAE